MDICTLKQNKEQPALITNWLAPLLLLPAFLPLPATATVQDVIFEQYVSNICLNRNNPLPGWNGAAVLQMCNIAFPTIIISPPPPTTVTSNFGATTTGNSLSFRNKKGKQSDSSEHDKKSRKGASADDGKWGWLVTPQFGNSTRSNTDLENGYQSDLVGLNIGVDYRHSDQLVVGAILGHTKNDAQYQDAAGSLKVTNSVLTMYGTWLASDKVAVDGYLGYGTSSLDSRRNIVLHSVHGTTQGNASGKQSMAGASVSYQQNSGRVDFSPFFNLDYANSTVDSYNETGSTGLELHHPERSVASLTSSLGARMGTMYSYKWGALTPSVRLATVHEFRNKPRQIYSELVITPGTGFVIATDAPDCNYLNFGLNFAAALNNGAQLFLDFDKRSQDSLLNSWAISFGGLMEF